MRVHLRHSQISLYYAGRKHWVSNPDSALDLGTIERASELSREEDFEQLEIVATFDEPGCDLVLAVEREGRPLVKSQPSTLRVRAELVHGDFLD